MGKGGDASGWAARVANPITAPLERREDLLVHRSQQSQDHNSTLTWSSQ